MKFWMQMTSAAAGLACLGAPALSNAPSAGQPPESEVLGLARAAGAAEPAWIDSAPDYDESGVLDATDLAILQGHVRSGDAAGDLNRDGKADQDDLLAFACMVIDPYAGDETTLDLGAMPADGETLLGEGRVVAEVSIDTGLRLYFVELEPGAVAVLEEAPEGAPGLDAVPGLSPRSSASDVFYAVSPAGTPIPAALRGEDAEAGSDAAANTATQGWARDALREGGQTAGYTNCDDRRFRNYINSFGYNDRNTPKFRLNKVPRSTSLFREYNYAPGNGQAYKFWKYYVGNGNGSRWYNIDRYVSRVSVCAIDTYEPANPYDLAHPPISYQGYHNNHMGPVVVMSYRRPGESVWSVATKKDFAASEVGKRLSWHFYTGYNWDWMTQVYWAGGDDKFDIGHAVEDLGQ